MRVRALPCRCAAGVLIAAVMRRRAGEGGRQQEAKHNDYLADSFRRRAHLYLRGLAGGAAPTLLCKRCAWRRGGRSSRYSSCFSDSSLLPHLPPLLHTLCRRHTAAAQNRQATAWNPAGGCGVQLSLFVTSPEPPGLFDSTILNVPSALIPVTSTVCTPTAHAPSAPSA